MRVFQAEAGGGAVEFLGARCRLILSHTDLQEIMLTALLLVTGEDLGPRFLVVTKMMMMMLKLI